MTPAAKRGRPAKAAGAAPKSTSGAQQSKPTSRTAVDSSNGQRTETADELRSRDTEEEGEEDREKIPEQLLTRILHDFFQQDGTRISKDANATIGRYMEIFIQEAIARAAAERGGGFLEVSFSLRRVSYVIYWKHLFLISGWLLYRSKI
jgi:centromere protein X